MGIAAYILMEKSKYSFEKLLADAVVASFHADLMLYARNKRFEEGNAQYTILEIFDQGFRWGHEDDRRFQVYVDQATNPAITFYHYDRLGFDPNQNLCQVGDIPDIRGAEEQIFHFIYQYLKRNPKDYFWVESNDWVYGWEDVKMLMKLPFNSQWCYLAPFR